MSKKRFLHTKTTVSLYSHTVLIMRGSITKAVYFLSDQDLIKCVRLISDSGQL